MKTFILSTFLAAGAAVTTLAQPLSVGSEVDDITLTTIDGEEISLYSYLDQGYTVLVDISATWCPPCWIYHQSHVSDSLYAHYGPEGTVDPDKFLVLYIEGDPRTTRDDLHGTGNATLGDWVTGSQYPIIEASDGSELVPFLSPGAVSITFPTFLLICPDRTVIWNNEGYNAGLTESFFVDKMETCEPVPTGVRSAHEVPALSVYPNPVVEQLNLEIVMQQADKASLGIVNLIGQNVYEEPLTLQAGAQVRSVNTSAMAPGIYLLTLSTSEGIKVQRKFIKR